MKNQAQTEDNDGTRRQSAQDALEQATGLMNKRIHTGPLVWNETEFDEAVRNGRFIAIVLTNRQRTQLQSDREPIELSAFLRVATGKQLKDLRDTTPLYWTAFQIDKNRAPELT